MKLASEIAEEVMKHIPSRYSTRKDRQVAIESIIAAKLEPVREALSCDVLYLRDILPGLTNGDQGEDWDTERCMQLTLSAQALAKLSEE